jgi:hypothetical protein
MKKIFIAVGILAICSTCALAQGLGLGIKAGVNIANQDISASYSAETSSQIGFHGGVFVVFMFTEKMGIQPELLYSTGGSEVDIAGDIYAEKLGYIILPVLFRYNINDMFCLHAGPQFGFLVSAEEEFNGDTEDIKDDFKGSDIAASFGVEVDLPIKLGIGARYALGLTDIVEEGGSWTGAEIKNGTFQIYAKFRLIGD